MRAVLVLLVLAGLAAVLLTRAEPFAPTAALETPVGVIGRATPVKVVAHDRGTGLARVELRLVPEGGAPVVLASESWPSRPGDWVFGGSGVHDATLERTVDAAAAQVAEGRARLEVWVADHSWLASLHRGPAVTRAVTVDVTPPTITVVGREHVARLGGSECLVYRVGPDAVRSGVQVGEEFFPGTPGYFADGALRAALFALPQGLPEARPAAVVTDAAGNARTAGMDIVVQPRRFAEKTLPITDGFLARKVPELLQANGLDASGDLVTGYLRINRDLRVATEKRVREICRDSAPAPLWEGAFVRLPNSAPLSGFADRRTYVYDGKPIDHQTHLGFDLASFRGSVVPAGNTGRVAFVGPLGIYGTAVIIDHGLGLFSLYGHLSETSVEQGAQVVRGDPIGKTGDTGLAGGDHLHFSVMIHGVHVDPVEWWDAHWIHDHVEARLAEFPRATAGGS
jgi:murein DD-endopeptidase MepM/ murein hydrolase activator NlpD